MAAQEEGRIVKTPGVLGGKPRIAGRRIGVYFVQQQVEERGLDPATVTEKYDLERADVYRALAYFYDHPDEMRRVEERRHRAIAEATSRTTLEPQVDGEDS